MKSTLKFILTAGLLLTCVLPGANGQTIFSGEQYLGVGLQAGLTKVNSQLVQTYSAGVSIASKADLIFSIQNIENEANESFTSVLSQVVFFPTLERTGELLSTEIAGGFGIGELQDSDIFTLGLGISKTVLGELDKNNIRPRVSFTYTLLTGGDDDSVNQPPVSTITSSAALELIAHFQSNQLSFLLTPYISFSPDQRESALGLSTSLIF